MTSVLLWLWGFRGAHLQEWGPILTGALVSLAARAHLACSPAPRPHPAAPVPACNRPP